MGVEISSIPKIRATRGKIALALGILAVLAMALTVFAVADYSETDGDVTYGKVAVTGGRIGATSCEVAPF